MERPSTRSTSRVHQSRPKHRVIQIRRSFLSRNDAECLRHGAVAQAPQLREDEPYPVAPFSASPKFRAYLREDRILGIDETLQVVRIVFFGSRHLCSRGPCSRIVKVAEPLPLSF